MSRSRSFHVLAGASGGGATGAVVLAPSTNTTNVIQPTSNFTSGVLDVKNAAGTALIFGVDTSTPNVNIGADINLQNNNFRIKILSTTILTFTNTTTITLAEGVNFPVGTVTGTKIGTATSQKIGFFNATPVIQQATTGTATGFTAGAGTGVTDQSTFTGGTGATAYRISDIVLALKNLGLMAA